MFGLSEFLLKLAAVFDAEHNPKLASKCRTYATIALNSAAIAPQPPADAPAQARAKKTRRASMK